MNLLFTVAVGSKRNNTNDTMIWRSSPSSSTYNTTLYINIESEYQNAVNNSKIDTLFCFKRVINDKKNQNFICILSNGDNVIFISFIFLKKYPKGCDRGQMCS